MCSGKSYLLAHPSWDNPDADTTCLLCSGAQQTFAHAIVSCPSAARQRSRLHQGVSDLAREAPIWSDQQLLIALAEFIRTTTTRFPPGMPPLVPCLHTPPNLFFSSTTPPTPGPRDQLVIHTFLFSYCCFVTIIGRIGGTGYVCLFC